MNKLADELLENLFKAQTELFLSENKRENFIHQLTNVIDSIENLKIKSYFLKYKKLKILQKLKSIKKVFYTNKIIHIDYDKAFLLIFNIKEILNSSTIDTEALKQALTIIVNTLNKININLESRDEFDLNFDSLIERKSVIEDDQNKSSQSLENVREVIRRVDYANVILTEKNLDKEYKNFIKNNKIYPVWFGTTRKPLDDSDLSKGFGNNRDRKVHYGLCGVFIPESHHFGEVGRPWFKRWIKLDFHDDNLKLKTIIPVVNCNDFWSKFKQNFNENNNDVLVFIHGYNTTFEEAAIRSAQIGFDLRVPGATAFFSWASKGNEKDYTRDEASIEGSEKAITEFLSNIVEKSGAAKIHLIAHSMGNRGLLRAFEKIFMDIKINLKIPFGQVILAAPDLDVELFQNVSHIYTKLSERTTIYVSPKDKAVGLSKWFHGFDRVGFTPPVTVANGIDTINVTGEFDLLDLGHSYFAEAESILHDIYELLRHNTPPSQRQRLREATDRQGKYWIMN